MGSERYCILCLNMMNNPNKHTRFTVLHVSVEADDVPGPDGGLFVPHTGGGVAKIEYFNKQAPRQTSP